MNEMNAGIGALSKPQSTSVGVPRQNMEEMMSLARKLSDAQLADILSGRSMDVPQFVAMTEAMGRKQLRTAMQGLQAQQQAQQPSIREQMVAETAPSPQMSAMPEEQGIGALPAPNLAQMDGMAGGGIVAFDNGGLTAGELERQAEEDRDFLMRGLLASGSEIGDRLMLPVQAVGSAGALLNRGLRAVGVPSSLTPTIPTNFTLEGASLGLSGGPMATAEKARRTAQEKQAAEIEAQDQALTGGPAKVEPVDTTGAEKRTAPVTAPVTAPAPAESEAVPDRFAQFEGSDADLETSLAQQKEQAQGEFLMQLGASLLTSPTLAKGLGEGTQKALPMLVSNKREANKLRNDAKAFKLDIAKAQEAAELGDREMAFRYEKLAADKAIAAGALAARKGIDAKTLFASANERIKEKLKNPVFASEYKGMTDEQKQQVLLNEVQQLSQLAAAVTGGGMMSSSGLPANLQASVDAEFNKRFGN
jgi:hypothetical protein